MRRQSRHRREFTTKAPTAPRMSFAPTSRLVPRLGALGALVVQSRRFWCILLAAIALWLPSSASTAAASVQTLKLARGWNLISLAVAPPDSNPAAVFSSLVSVGALRAVWHFEAASGQWSRFPALAGQPSLSQMQAGSGYWIDVDRAIEASILGLDDGLPPSPGALRTGWNLVGFPISRPDSYERLLNGVPVRQVWTYDAGTRRFRGVVFPSDGSDTPIVEDFVNLEPGRGYWLLLDEESSLEPQLATALPGDVDVPPLLENVVPGARPPFGPMVMSAGDRDLAGDGFYDRSESQRAVDFGDFSDRIKLAIFNQGRGILGWRVRVQSPDEHPWLRFFVAGEIPSEDQVLEELEGTVATETAEVDLAVDRTGLGPGEYTARILVESNGATLPFPAEPVREIVIRMTVPPLDGDYEVTAVIETINGTPADTHNPRYFLSLYRDGKALRGIFDGSRSLLVPDYCIGGSTPGKSCSANADCGTGRCERYVRLVGRVYEDGTNRFTVSASFELPVGADDNPYQVPLRRDITLVGDRPKSGEANLGPQDLRGDFRETLYNVLALPIVMEGSFVARRKSPAPSVRDLSAPASGQASDIPDNGNVLTRTLNVAENLLLSEVDVALNLTHPRPADLVVSLTSPSGTTVVLRDHTNTVAGDLIYDETAVSEEDLGAFVGQSSAGTWTLRIIDDVTGPELPGALIRWGLNLNGTRVNRIAGTVAGVGADAVVLLSGCGLVRQTTTGTNGAFAFANLIDCVYAISVHESGFARARTFVSLQGADRTNVSLAPAAAGADAPIVVTLPVEPGGAKAIASLTTAGGGGLLQTPAWAFINAGRLRYALDSANHDIDRPPLGGALGDEDSDGFGGGVDPLTGTNIAGADGNYDPPANAAKRRGAFVTIGQPVIGRAVSGTTYIAIGANP